MIKEALQYLAQLGVEAKAPLTLEIESRNYTDKHILPVEVPLDEAITASTLDGFADLIGLLTGGEPAKFFVHILSPAQVALVSKECTVWGQRQKLAYAQLPEAQSFPFGTWMDHETFFIRLQTLMAAWVDSTDSDYLLRIAANVTAEDVATSEDDGISQKVAVKRGISLKSGEVLRPRVQLAPFRTFREAEQPVSSFIFRAKVVTDGQPPHLALFEADGGAWKIHAVKNIQNYLATKNLGLPVVA